jgi:hypothetical protein
MKIQIGEIRMNDFTSQGNFVESKTRKYLLPCLKEYGEEFTRRVEAVYKVAVGIGDIIVDKHTNLKCEKHIFILLGSWVAKPHFVDFIDWIRKQPMYVDDYVYDDIQKTDLHMIILKFPEKYWDSLKSFMRGKYSEMFDKETINKLFNNHPEVRKVLVKDKRYRLTFVNRLNRTWETSIDPESYDGELETKPTDEEERFNHHLK